MKLKCLGCHALTRLVYLSAAYSPHLVDIALMPIGLHNEPLKLRVQLQQEIDGAVSKGYDAIVLAYGLCGQATAGLVARDIPLVIPRAHDCITLFLGSRERYQAEFEREPGTYWYVQDYIERREGKGTSLSIGAGLDTNMDEVYEEYVAKYGKENADYLMEVMGAWQQHYKRAVYIDMGVGDGQPVAAATQSEATRRGWSFEQIEGNLILIRQLLGGEWGTDFLVVQPGERIAMAYGDDVVHSVPILLK